MNYLGIYIDLHRDTLLSDQARDLMQSYYMKDCETSPQQAFARAAVAYCGGDMTLAQRIYNAASMQWFMFASPILSNAPLPHEQHKGLPISCFLSEVEDSVDGLIEHNEELARLSVAGGGVGGHWSQIRGVNNKSVGVIPHIKIADSLILGYKQQETRKGSYAAYLDIDHPDIVEFIHFKLPTGGDISRKCFNIFNAVNITDEFMEAVKNGKSWSLVCPHSKQVTEVVDARYLWERLLEARFRTGTPYLNFIDTANAALPQAQKDLGLRIKGSNLCNEIHLATDADRTAVCCLSSVNLAKYNDWKDTGLVADLVTFLDNVLTAFIAAAPASFDKATHSAYSERSIGIGAMGFHSLLQKRGIPWESALASSLNQRIFKEIKDEATRQTLRLGELRGSAPDYGDNTGPRNMHLLAIAPNANSGVLCGTSASIEPIKSNCFVHRTRAGSHVVKNKDLEVTLSKLGHNTEEVWSSIIKHDGSVQHLEFLDDYTKDIFKTASEIDQNWVVEHAAKRQQYICQGQSVNLFFSAGAPRAYVNRVHLKAYFEGLKGLYYLRTTAGRTGDKVGDTVQRAEIKAITDTEECLSCQG